jgi:hypothetical protein
MFDWLILIIIISFAFYALFIIKKEKTTFLEDCYFVNFEKITLPIPRWWTLVHQENFTLTFKRTDTRYDWMAHFTFIPDETQIDLTEVLSAKIKDDEIYYDENDIVIETNPAHLFSDPKTQEYFSEVLRVEGKATEKTTERIYLDLVIMRGHEEKGYFIFESKSSVLNGLLEGPYFEESLKLIKLQLPHDVSEQNL